MSGLTPLWNSFSAVGPPLAMCNWCGLTIQVCGLLGLVVDSSAMDMTRGTGALFKYLHPTKAPKNSYFSLLSEEKSGVLTLEYYPTRFLDFPMWERHFTCLVTILALRSPQHLIKCSRRHFVPRILRWDGDPTASVSPQILGGIIPTQFCPLYRALRGVIFSTLQILKPSKLPNFQTFKAFQTSKSSRS